MQGRACRLRLRSVGLCRCVWRLCSSSPALAPPRRQPGVYVSRNTYLRQGIVEWKVKNAVVSRKGCQFCSLALAWLPLLQAPPAAPTPDLCTSATPTPTAPPSLAPPLPLERSTLCCTIVTCGSTRTAPLPTAPPQSPWQGCTARWRKPTRRGAAAAARRRGATRQLTCTWGASSKRCVGGVLGRGGGVGGVWVGGWGVGGVGGRGPPAEGPASEPRLNSGHGNTLHKA